MIRAQFAIAPMLCLGALIASASAQNQQFNNYTRKPSVSPYMQLLNNQTGTATNYQSLVRPQLDQRSFNQQSSSAIRQLQKGGGGTAGSSKSGVEGNKKLRSTGHVVSTENYSHYFPGMKPRR
jgi:hypothetical protein